MAKRVLSGIRASGRLHLGNYLGAVKGMLELQNNPEYETFYMVADAHSITTPYNAFLLKEDTKSVVIDYLAAGLDPEKSVIFVQSMVPEHFEMAFYLSTMISVARMQHLPTFKEKVKQYPRDVTMALLNYPVLMAADILLYKAGNVPVGVDQEPHLEIARQIARNMNSKYGTNFPEPQIFSTPGKCIPSLTGEGKMSKSVEGSYILLVDDLETIKKKLALAPTDAGSGEKVPESGSIYNLLQLVELFQGIEKRKAYEDLYVSSGIKYQELKTELASAIFDSLKPIQEKRREIEAKPEYVNLVIKSGAEKAKKVAGETLRETKEKMGFLLI